MHWNNKYMSVWYWTQKAPQSAVLLWAGLRLRSVCWDCAGASKYRRPLGPPWRTISSASCGGIQPSSSMSCSDAVFKFNGGCNVAMIQSDFQSVMSENDKTTNCVHEKTQSPSIKNTQMHKVTNDIYTVHGSHTKAKANITTLVRVISECLCPDATSGYHGKQQQSPHVAKYKKNTNKVHQYSTDQMYLIYTSCAASQYHHLKQQTAMTTSETPTKRAHLLDSLMLPSPTSILFGGIVRLFHTPTHTTSSGCLMLHRTVHALWNLYGNPYRNRAEKEEETVTWWGKS